MNLLEEREYYKPFNYPWAFEHYKTQQHMHWLPDEVPLADDLKDYREKMSDGQKKLLSSLFRFFTQADVDVCCGYAKHYLPTFKQPEVRMMLSAFASMEAVHQEAYSLLLETLGFGDDEYQKFLNTRRCSTNTSIFMILEWKQEWTLQKQWLSIPDSQREFSCLVVLLFY